MGIVKIVQNGDKTATFRAVPLSTAVTILFGLCSVIGAQQTWLWAGAHERAMLAEQMDTKIDRALASEKAVAALHFLTLDAEVRGLNDRLNAAERQININTGKLEQGAAWRAR